MTTRNKNTDNKKVNIAEEIEVLTLEEPKLPQEADNSSDSSSTDSELEKKPKKPRKKMGFLSFSEI